MATAMVIKRPSPENWSCSPPISCIPTQAFSSPPHCSSSFVRLSSPKLRSICFSPYLPVGFRSFLPRSPRLHAPSVARWTAATWLDSTVQVEVGVPLSEAWDLWNDRERLNRWMPWIHSIRVLRDRPELSEWLLKYNAFGQDFEFKWKAKNLQPIYHQKIHWRSVDGLPNRGVVRFYPRCSTSVGVQLTIYFEVPDVLAGAATLLSPLVTSILKADLDRFATFAKENRLKASA